jgi:hypothetical protein
MVDFDWTWPKKIDRQAQGSQGTHRRAHETAKRETDALKPLACSPVNFTAFKRGFELHRIPAGPHARQHASYEDYNGGHFAPKACDAAGALPCGAGSECKSANGGVAKCQAILRSLRRRRSPASCVSGLA